MKQTRQPVRAVKQSIYLNVYATAKVAVHKSEMVKASPEPKSQILEIYIFETLDANVNQQLLRGFSMTCGFYF
jgi:hypothetical protein